MFIGGRTLTPRVRAMCSLKGFLARGICLLLIRLRSSGPLRVHHQQYNPADEHQRSDDRRNEVIVSGRNAQAEKLDRLSRGREAYARVSEHHDAQGDENGGSYGFGIHIESPV